MCIALSLGRDKKVTCSTALGDTFPGFEVAEARPVVHYLHTALQKKCKHMRQSAMVAYQGLTLIICHKVIFTFLIF